MMSEKLPKTKKLRFVKLRQSNSKSSLRSVHFISLVVKSKEGGPNVAMTISTSKGLDTKPRPTPTPMVEEYPFTNPDSLVGIDVQLNTLYHETQEHASVSNTSKEQVDLDNKSPFGDQPTMVMEDNDRGHLIDGSDIWDLQCSDDLLSLASSPLGMAPAISPPLPLETSDLPLFCPHLDCYKTFTKAAHLRKHLTHHGPKLHVCSECHKAFAEASKLKRHSLVHSGERPYKCEYPSCGKLFSLAHNLRTHQFVHTGCKPYACSYPDCDMRFSQLTNLKTHMRCVHSSGDGKRRRQGHAVHAVV